MNRREKIVDHLVLGGGPAGAMAAIRLAQAGQDVTLLEKERRPHDKVCGEFLSAEAIEYLEQAGVSPQKLGAVPIRNLRLCVGGQSAATALPFPALSLSRRVLDAALLDRAANLGCTVVRGARVERLVDEGDAWMAKLADGANIRAHTVFLATGKHDLQGWARGRGAQNDLIGFKMHWRLNSAQTLQLQERMELFLFPGGYGGLALVEDELANFCVVIRRSAWQAVQGWSGFLCSLLAANSDLRQRLEGAQPLWERPLAISPIPYGYLRRSPSRLWCVGDQAAVVPSFTGDGMSIALHSASLALQIFLDGRSAEVYYRELAAHLGRSVALATWISRAMVSRAGPRLALPAARLHPGVMRSIAALTRIPQHTLRTADRACVP
jgi:menaquinone-9 beta-reductase